ncbi:MAG: hypothetical protein GY847_15295 [Proteobacteria bacterium]|nr:hypothetical protein [Pseudomonadota bacterium]
MQRRNLINYVHNANGLFLIIYEDDERKLKPEVAYGMTKRFFEPPDYLSGEAPNIFYVYVPFVVVIDLETMKVLGRGLDTFKQIKELVDEAND